jgi:hypothetical protein
LFRSKVCVREHCWGQYAWKNDDGQWICSFCSYPRPGDLQLTPLPLVDESELIRYCGKDLHLMVGDNVYVGQDERERCRACRKALDRKRYIDRVGGIF